ncbi:MAG TPA: zinc ABC transporter substrate-binding protein [Chlamydiales bacterium]|nr:zinc ABC transporter substrate-binding protein [Chlamydiales bacterium]
MVVLIKNLLFVILAATLCFSCSKKQSVSPLTQWMRENDKIKILSTIAQIGDLTQAIGGDRVDSLVLVPKDLDPHSYELVKGDGEKLSRADLIFYNGLGLEHGASLSSLLQTTDRAVPLGEGIRTIYPDRILEKNGVPDPHIWMDISLWEAAAGIILKKISEQDPAGTEYYQQRASALIQEMQDTHSYVHALLQKIPSEKRFLVTSHDAFSYFTRSYLADPGESNWSRRFTAPEGLAPDGQINPIDIRKTIEFLRSHQIHVIFPESNVSRDAALKIAKAGSEMGYKIRLCDQPLYGDSTGGLSYLEMMRRNAEVISQNLGGTR